MQDKPNSMIGRRTLFCRLSHEGIGRFLGSGGGILEQDASSRGHNTKLDKVTRA